MLPLALAIAAAAPVADLDGFVHFASPAFDRFAFATDRACPDRRLRFISPADLDLIAEDFLAAQPRRDRQRIAALDAGGRRYAGTDGLTCPTMATLDAIAATGATDRFAGFACPDPLPR